MHEMIFDKRDFQDMTFKVNGVKDVTKAEGVKDIDELKELPQETIKYLAYVYDSNSPVVKRSRDLNERKERAAKMAGVDGPVSLDDEKVVSAIHAMLRYQGSYEWSLITMNEETFYENLKRILSPVEDDKDKDEITALEKKEKLLGFCDEIHSRLKDYKRTFYMGDVELQEKSDRIRFSPEAIAKHV